MGACLGGSGGDTAGGSSPDDGASAKSASSRDKAAGEAEKKKKKTQLYRGYTVEQFVNHSLVPVEGIACWTPLDTKRAKELTAQVKELNQDRMAEQRLEAEQRRRRQVHSNNGDLQAARRLPVPLEAICRVRLSRVELEEDQAQSFDFNQESTLRVHVFGGLHFPPDQPARPTLDDGLRKRRRRGREQEREEDPHERRWYLKIKVTVALERVTEESELKEDVHVPDEYTGTKLKVRVERMKIEREVSNSNTMEGDPMVESWLPIDDVKASIECMLDDKLSQAVVGIEANNDRFNGP